MSNEGKLNHSKLKIIYKDRYFLVNFLISIFLNLTAWLFLYLNFKPQTEPVILHYNIYFGIDLIGAWYKIFFIPLFGLVCFFINFALSVIIYTRAKILSYFLIHTSSLIQILMLLTVVFLIFQNL